jgi:hypothetical protein
MANDDQKTPRHNEGLVDKTIANMDEMITADKKRRNMKEGRWPGMNEAEKQQLYVEASMARCRRCGDFAPAFPVAAPLAILCDHCEKVYKAMDGCMWFADMVHAISQKKGKKS